MRKQTLKLALFTLLSLAVAGVIAQSVNETSSSSNGNGEAMEHNLNFPNAVTPADNNIQDHERAGGIIKTEHPKENLSNTYNSKRYLGEKK